MKISPPVLIPFFTLVSPLVQGYCLSESALKDNMDVTLTAQISYVNKEPSIWKIDGRNPYTTDNAYNDVALGIKGQCELVDNNLNMDFSFYSLGYYAIRRPGAFEKDKDRARILIDRLSFTYALSDTTRLEGGKLRPSKGAFFLRSPATLLTNYYSGFKTTRIYGPAMESAYSESFWGTTLSKEYHDYNFLLTIAPRLSSIDKYYESSGNWSAAQRSNSEERYLLSYNDYRLASHRLSANLLLGDNPAFSLSELYNYTSQFLINAEFSWHKGQQWRHFSNDKKEAVLAGVFPSSLYSAEDKQGVEFALGGQYTTDSFSVFGLEYYFQSEGYSKKAWQDQIDFIRLMGYRTGYDFLNRVFDNYKYLMASEIGNTSNRGMLLSRHYFNTYFSLHNHDQSTLQPYAMINIADGSVLFGAHFIKPLQGKWAPLELYSGAYSSLGSSESEFALFGETLSIYVGFKYYL
ncbi:hypothetical protein ACOV22_000786 [Klebsiella michiganensis]